MADDLSTGNRSESGGAVIARRLVRWIEQGEAWLGSFYATALCAGCLIVPAAIVLEYQMLAVHPLVHAGVAIALLLLVYGRVLWLSWTTALRGELPFGPMVATGLTARPRWWCCIAGGWWLLHFLAGGFVLGVTLWMQPAIPAEKQVLWAAAAYGTTVASNLFLCLVLARWCRQPTAMLNAWRHRFVLDLLVVTAAWTMGRI